VAETITNNMRKVIIDERAMNPKYYDRMSQLLDALIEQRRQGAIEYKEYLAKLIEQAQQLGAKQSDTAYPDWANTGARRALYDFGLPSEQTATSVDQTILESKPDHWIGNPMKEKRVKRALRSALPPDYDRLDELFELIKARHEYT
jgi:type I restriction enzyme R subunit